MKLNMDCNWRAVHMGARTVLRTDRNLYPQPAWEYLCNRVEVEPTEEAGHYRVVDLNRT